jgi:hypothetical protein
MTGESIDGNNLRTQHDNSAEQRAEIVQELTDWIMRVADGERFVDVGFVIVIRDGRVVRKKRIHESFD